MEADPDGPGSGDLDPPRLEWGGSSAVAREEGALSMRTCSRGDVGGDPSGLEYAPDGVSEVEMNVAGCDKFAYSDEPMGERRRAIGGSEVFPWCCC